MVNLFCLAFQSLSFLSFRIRKDATLQKALGYVDGSHVGGDDAANS